MDEIDTLVLATPRLDMKGAIQFCPTRWIAAEAAAASQ